MVRVVNVLRFEGANPVVFVRVPRERGIVGVRNEEGSGKE